MDTIFPLFWFDTGGSAPEKLAEDVSGTETTGKGGKLYCHLCRHQVTDRGQRISLQGGHVHTRTNPAGYVYDFGCYQNAPGCRSLGPRTDEHTWFPGHSWQIAVCGNCGEHLGWLFNGVSRFYGLIIGRLVSNQE